MGFDVVCLLGIVGAVLLVMGCLTYANIIVIAFLFWIVFAVLNVAAICLYLVGVWLFCWVRDLLGYW